VRSVGVGVRAATYPPEYSVPFGPTARDLTASVCPRSTRTVVHERVHHTRTVVSLEPEYKSARASLVAVTDVLPSVLASLSTAASAASW
jgi:hypothetical protein